MVISCVSDIYVIICMLVRTEKGTWNEKGLMKDWTKGIGTKLGLSSGVGMTIQIIRLVLLKNYKIRMWCNKMGVLSYIHK